MERRSPDRERIIELFARRQPTYAGADVRRLLNLSEEQFAEHVAREVLTTEVDEEGLRVIPWDDVALLALQEWTPRMIQAAVRYEDDEVIPLFNQHRRIIVSLPIYLIRLLDHLARIESGNHHLPRNASDILEQALHDFANAQDIGTVDTAVPGFARALRFPYFTPRTTGVLWLRCRYCGISITEASREVCRACQQRHEPDEHRGQYSLPELEDPHGPDETQPLPTSRSKRRARAAKKSRARTDRK